MLTNWKRRRKVVAVPRGSTATAATAAIVLAAWLVPSAAAAPQVSSVQAAASAAAAAPSTPSTPSGSAAPIGVLPVRPGFYMLTVAGMNIGLETGPEGVVVINTGPPSASASLLAKIRELSGQPIRFVVDTSADPNLVGGNEPLSVAGRSMMIGWGLLAQFQNEDDKITDHLLETRAPIIARTAALAQLVSYYTDSGQSVPPLALPSETFARPQYNFRINGDIVNVVRMPPAHSAADSVVLFRRADVVVTGAIFDVTRFPVIDLPHGGSIDGEIDAINQVMNTLAVPSGPVVDSEDGTRIIPLHGRLCDQPDLLTYRDMLQAVRDRVQNLIDHHQNLRQVEAADPTQGYERRFGATAGDWTTKNFIDAVYHSLVAAKAHQRAGGGSREVN